MYVIKNFKSSLPKLSKILVVMEHYRKMLVIEQFFNPLTLKAAELKAAGFFKYV